jgi:septal ring factor EnvC (AmiA/AmiB activator)
MNKPALLLLGFWVAGSLGWATAQTKQELKKERRQKQQEIAFTKKLISKTSERQRKTVDYLKVLNQQIKNRESLIRTIQQQVKTLDSTIATNESVIQSLEDDLASLKDEYAGMVRFAYKTRNQYQKLAFVFSASSFNQAYKRLRFLGYYADFRQEQLSMIRETQNSLESRVQNLEERKAEKRALLTAKQEEKQELKDDLSQKRQLVSKLKSKKSRLRRKLNKKQQRARELANAIQASIRREREKASESESKAYANTPEAEVESNRFEQNKSSLPWPVEQGFISSEFGKHEHPTLDGVQVKNNGIHITTSPEAKAKAVFAGEVRRIVEQRGSGMGVLVRHGEYYTVYSNLQKVMVDPGEQIEANEVVGIVRTNTETGNAELHFQVWQSFDKLNPEKWLARQ